YLVDQPGSHQGLLPASLSTHFRVQCVHSNVVELALIGKTKPVQQCLVFRTDDIDSRNGTVPGPRGRPTLPGIGVGDILSSDPAVQFRSAHSSHTVGQFFHIVHA